jgi:hypothetical protein
VDDTLKLLIKAREKPIRYRNNNPRILVKNAIISNVVLAVGLMTHDYAPDRF